MSETTQNKTETQSTMILDQYRVTGFLCEVKYEDDNICESSGVQGSRYQICGARLKVTKTLKSLIKDEGDLDQNDVG
jgi:hypothetical protein